MGRAAKLSHAWTVRAAPAAYTGGITGIWPGAAGCVPNVSLNVAQVGGTPFAGASRHRNAFGLDGEPARPAGPHFWESGDERFSFSRDAEVLLEEPADPLAALASVAASFA